MSPAARTWATVNPVILSPPFKSRVEVASGCIDGDGVPRCQRSRMP